MEQGQLNIYAALNKALYGSLRASVLFWRKPTDKLIEWGYKINPYDWCVADKTIQGNQCKLLLHVHYLKISHLSQEGLKEEAVLINDHFRPEAPLKINRGGGLMNT